MTAAPRLIIAKVFLAGPEPKPWILLPYGEVILNEKWQAQGPQPHADDAHVDESQRLGSP